MMPGLWECSKEAEMPERNLRICVMRLTHADRRTYPVWKE